MIRFYPNSKSKGFSLVEMLSTIGVIGVISAIALPSMTRVNQGAREATAKRNAQHIASIFQSAQEAGLNFVDPSGDVDVTISNVVNGGLVDGGAFDGSFFGLPNLAAEDQSEAAKYLAIEAGALQYQPGKANLVSPIHIATIGPMAPTESGVVPGEASSQGEIVTDFIDPVTISEAGGGEAEPVVSGAISAIESIAEPDVVQAPQTSDTADAPAQ